MLVHSLWKGGPTYDICVYDEKMSAFITTLFTHLETRLLLNFKAPGTRCCESVLQVVSSRRTRHPFVVSWQDNGEEGTIMISLVELLLSAWLLSATMEKELLADDIHISSAVIQALRSCKPCLSILCISMGLADEMPRILTQVPACEFSRRWKESLKDLSRSKQYELRYELDVRIVCPDPQSRVEKPRPSLVIWTTHLSLHTSQLQQLEQYDKEIGDLLDWQEIRRMVIDRVEKNDDGQLDRWQQQYMLACLKWKYDASARQHGNLRLNRMISQRSKHASDEGKGSEIFTVSSIQERI